MARQGDDDSETDKPEGYVDLSAHTLPEESKDDGDSIRFILSCRNESKLAKWNRIQQTRENWDSFWGRHDFSHKAPGQSRETLSMQSMAVEQTASFFQQSLVDMGDEWWSVGAKNPKAEDTMKVAPATVQALTQQQLLKADLLRHVGLGMKSGLLGGLIITKVHGCYENTPQYVAERAKKGRKATLRKIAKKTWRLKLDVISQFNYYPDPTPGTHKLYEIEDMWCDYHTILEQAEGDDAIYDHEMCERIERKSDDDAEEKFDQMRRTNQNEVSHAFRGRVKLTEFWGTILGNDGEVLHENCVATLANDKWLIRKPTPNPLWHQKTPYITAALLDSPDAAWPKALADAGTKYNIAANELFNLMLDGAMRSVNGINQIRQDWLEDPAQVEGGIKPGTNLGINSQCPPGAKVIEQLLTGNVPPDSMNLNNLLNQEFNRAMLTSDIRQGMQPRKDVPATQIVETSQTITSVFKGMSQQVEQAWIQRLLSLAALTTMQFSDDIDENEVKTTLDPDVADRFLAMTPEERFAHTVQGMAFEVFGISLSIQRQADYRKVMTLLQTIGASEPLMEAFVKRFSFDEFLNYAMRSLGIPTKQLEISAAEQEMMAQGGGAGPQPPGASAPAPGQSPAGPQGQPTAPGTQPNQMSQVQSPNTGSAQDTLGSAAGLQAQPGPPSPIVAHGNYSKGGH